MSIPLVDLHLKFVVDYTLKAVLSDPDRYLCEIFGDARLDPHAALYGERLIAEVKKWFTTTRIPVVLGYEVDPTQLPGISIHLNGNSPVQSYMGDIGFVHSEPLQPYEREIVVPAFSPKNIEIAEDGCWAKLTLPKDFPLEQYELLLPGFNFRDKNGNEYLLTFEGDSLLATPIAGGALIKDSDLSSIEVISPITEARYQDGAMYYNEQLLVTVHGHSDRVEGLWLWAIVQWGLLKYRPLLTETFGLDLATPTAADFAKDDSYQGENVWRRFISLSVKTNYSWTSIRMRDAVAFRLSVKASMTDLFTRAVSETVLS